MKHLIKYQTFEIWLQKNSVVSSNTYLLLRKEPPKATLIDPGSETSELVSFLKLLRIRSVTVLLTHGHFDHVLGVPELIDSFDTNVFLNPKDEIHLKKNNFYLRALGIQEKVREFEFKSFETGCDYGFPIKVYEAPGHTSGGMIFSLNGCVFVGDLISPTKVFVPTVPGYDKSLWLRSVQSAWNLMLRHSLVCFGHGHPLSPAELFSKNEDLRSILSDQRQSGSVTHGR